MWLQRIWHSINQTVYILDRWWRNKNWDFEGDVSIGGHWWHYKWESTILGPRSGHIESAEEGTGQHKRGQRFWLCQV